jgi:antitoxin (DNA-binding transcriptional repressor) of toxin-antitoxin stability system
LVDLSQLLDNVKAGEEILITERGRPVARIVKENKGDKSILAALGPLIQKALVVLPSRSILKDRHAPLKVSGKPISEMVVEDRR